MNRSAAAVRTVILLLLASAGLSQTTTLLTRTPGLDFYQFWGVPVAGRLAPTLGTPYRDGARYVETLRAYAAGSSDAKLKAAAGFWSGPDFAGSPFLYTIFTVVPSDYSLAVTVFRILVLVLFLAGLWRLGRRYGFDRFVVASLALLCLLTYQPLLSDLRMGNLGGLQLFYLAGLLTLAELLVRRPGLAQRTALGALFLVALAALTLAKPNVALISVLLVAHLATRLGPRAFAFAAGPAAIATALLVLLPSLYFGGWIVWREWYAFVYGANPYMLVRPFASGNFSTALLLSTWLGLDIFRVSLTLLAILALALSASALWSSAVGRASWSARGRAAVTRLFGDASVVLGVGIVLVTATSPLYWLHYYVLLLIPGLWLLGGASRSLAATVLAGVGVLMSSGMLDSVFRPLQWSDASPVVIALSWLPLWVAILIQLASKTATLDAPMNANPTRDVAEREARRPAASPARRRKR